MLMLRPMLIFSAAALALSLSACGGTMASTSGNSGSGITVFGEIDAAVTHTR